jgi:hypothetical protein
MFRKITKDDWELYRHYVDVFYHTDAVNAPVPEENYRATFDEMMRSDAYVKGYIFECEESPCGFVLLSKTFSQEAGGVSVTIEEIYIDPEYRRDRAVPRELRNSADPVEGSDVHDCHMLLPHAPDDR